MAIVTVDLPTNEEIEKSTRSHGALKAIKDHKDTPNDKDTDVASARLLIDIYVVTLTEVTNVGKYAPREKLADYLTEKT